MNQAPTQEKAPARACNTEPGKNQERQLATAPDWECQPRVPEFTAGHSLFHDPLTGAYRLVDIRFHLERKLAACVAIGGTNGYPILPARIKNPMFRSLVAYGTIFSNWSLRDLTECTDLLEGAASLALIASLEKPIWGQADYLLLETLERMEQLQSSAWGSNRTL